MVNTMRQIVDVRPSPFACVILAGGGEESNDVSRFAQAEMIPVVHKPELCYLLPKWEAQRGGVRQSRTE